MKQVPEWFGMSDNWENYFHYWGKSRSVPGSAPHQSYHLLVYHSLDVAAVGLQILKSDPALSEKFTPSGLFPDHLVFQEWLNGAIPFLLALHDIGKFSDRFQNLVPELLEELKGITCNRRYTVHHTDMGRALFEKDVWQKIWSQNWFCLDEHDDQEDWKEAFKPWFFAVAGHHGVPPKRSDYSLSNLFEDENRESALLFAEACGRLFLNKEINTRICFSESIIQQFYRISWLLAGLSVLSDWIGSNNDFFPACATPMPLERYWNDYAVPRAEKAIRIFGILPCTISPESGMHALFPAISSPTPLQSFAESCHIPSTPQLFIIEEATGSGKTEAALILAHRMMSLGLGEGIYLGLPTMATANAMYDRLTTAYQLLYSPDTCPSLILAHSARHLSEKFRQSIGYSHQDVPEQEFPDEMPASAQCSIWLSDNRKKAMLAHIGIGTIDQALMAVLPFRHQSMRLLGLSRNILIVDEVHAYDPYVARVLQNLLEFHAAMGGSAILLSATLPKAQRQGYLTAYSAGLGYTGGNIRQSHYPLVSHVTPGAAGSDEFPIQRCEMTARTVEVACTDDPAHVRRYISDALEAGRCTCWVKNTVDDAIETYQTISKQFPEAHVLLFHARFAMGDRLRIEQEVLRMFGKESDMELRSGKILIATQVIEQSLDLDFDSMVTDLAPMDLIIQRAGRLHRHTRFPKRGNRGVPRLIVFTPPVSESVTTTWYSALFPKAAFVYENHGQLWLTARLLTEQGHITMPDDARLLIEGTFNESAQKEIPYNLKDQEGRAEGRKFADRAIAQLNILQLNKGYTSTVNQWQEDTRTPTRLGEAKVTVLLLRWDGSRLSFWSSEGDFAEEMSQITISERKISRSREYGGVLGIALNELKNNLKGRGKWRVLVPLREVDGIWQGEALDDKNGEVVLHYDERIGLVVKK